MRAGEKRQLCRRTPRRLLALSEFLRFRLPTLHPVVLTGKDMKLALSKLLYAFLFFSVLAGPCLPAAAQDVPRLQLKVEESLPYRLAWSKGF